MRVLQGYSAAALKDGGGFTDARELLCGGYTGTELRECGFRLRELKLLLTTEQLLQAGFSAAQLLQQGKLLHELRECGVAADDLRSSGRNCSELLAAGYDLRALVLGGFTVWELHAAGCKYDLFFKFFLIQL
jgi:intracellular multiplication protein IcmE